MFEHLRPQPEDPILALMDRYRADPRTDKIDLGVGVYRNSQGVTPVMQAVKTAERQLVDGQDSKGYTGLAGDPAFIDAMAELVLGDVVAADRVAGAGTVGGTGAVRQGLELIRLARPGVTVHIPDPSWPNHRAILQAMGMAVKTYRYFDAEANGLDMTGLLEDLRAVPAGDVVLLHGCCHNPTGADPSDAQWQEIVATLKAAQVTALIDLAYLGFGDGIAEDAFSTRLMVQELGEVIVAVSCSKNFGLYRERAGVVLVTAADADARAVVQGNLATLNRLAYSFPADHGARVVEMILNSSALRAEWATELSEMRGRINSLRGELAAALQAETGSDQYAFLAVQRGMFSRLTATPDQIRTLRDDHGIYIIGDGRMNMAGLSKEDIPRLARAIAEVCA
ncbi:aromatic amino acid transaminase [Pseudooceanicola onchidii]|uniref:amino acid aminotransferase n=1 Tax=Pseudooceanicola onchidii TaxID=2562279 RepID=UPI0010AA7B7F|nr:amino acid aminotransferase [Pseudooceanicola onchidii]